MALAREIATAFVTIQANNVDYDVAMKKLKTSLTGLGGTLALAFAGKKIWDFGSDMVKLASDAVETGQKFDVVFAGIGDQAEEASKKFSKGFDLSTRTTKELLGNTGDLLNGFGMTKKEALALSIEANSLAADLTSLRNIEGGVSVASKKLNSAMIGNVRAAYELGIAVRQDEPAFKAKVRALMESTGATHQSAKAQVILKEAINQSKNAIGDYERTQDSLANQQRKVAEQWIEFKTIIGEFVTALFSINDVTTGVASSLENINDKMKNFSVRIITVIEMVKAFAAAIAAQLAAPFILLYKLGYNTMADLIFMIQFTASALGRLSTGSTDGIAEDWEKLQGQLKKNNPWTAITDTIKETKGTMDAAFENAYNNIDKYKNKLDVTAAKEDDLNDSIKERIQITQGAASILELAQKAVSAGESGGGIGAGGAGGGIPSNVPTASSVSASTGLSSSTTFSPVAKILNEIVSTIEKSNSILVEIRNKTGSEAIVV